MVKRLPGVFEYNDLLQEALLAVWKARQKYNPALNSNFRGYSYKAIKGAVLMSVRRKNWKESIHVNMNGLDTKAGSGLEIPNYGESMDHQKAMRVILQECLPLLCRPERIVIVRLFLQGAPWSAVAEELGCCLMTVSIIRQRALLALRTLLRDRGLEISSIDWQ